MLEILQKLVNVTKAGAKLLSLITHGCTVVEEHSVEIDWFRTNGKRASYRISICLVLASFRRNILWILCLLILLAISWRLISSTYLLCLANELTLLERSMAAGLGRLSQWLLKYFIRRKGRLHCMHTCLFRNRTSSATWVLSRISNWTTVWFSEITHYDLRSVLSDLTNWGRLQLYSHGILRQPLQFVREFMRKLTFGLIILIE